jgi:hypothetical protein
MTTKSREYLFSASVRAQAERAANARKSRPLGLRGVKRTHARLPRAGAAVAGHRDALSAGYRYLEVKCCNTHQTDALDIVRQPKATPVHELERYMRCKDCSQVRRYAYKRSQLIALRTNKITADSPASSMWLGDRD